MIVSTEVDEAAVSRRPVTAAKPSPAGGARRERKPAARSRHRAQVVARLGFQLVEPADDLAHCTLAADLTTKYLDFATEVGDLAPRARATGPRCGRTPALCP